MTATTVLPRLTPYELDRYDDRGFIVVRGVFNPTEIFLASMEADRLFGMRELQDTKNIRCRWKDHETTGECLFECFDPVIDLSPILDQLARDPRLISLASSIYGEQAHLFKDKLIFKPPGTKGYDLHQDYISWPGFPKSAAVAIDPCSRDNGATEVFAGYHKRGYLAPMDGDYHNVPDGIVTESEGVFLEMKPGDVALFGAFVPHRSASNLSDDWRRLLYLSYNADSEGGDQRAEHYAEFSHWLKGKYAQYGKHETYFR